MAAADAGGPRLAAISSYSATPATISFAATDPDGAPVSSSPSALLSANINGGVTTLTWNIRVRAAAANLTGCSKSIPVSAVTVATCSASATGGGTANCQTPFTLTTAYQVLVSGMEGAGAFSITTNVTYTLAESWSYIGTSTPCTVTLNYNLTAN